jgi:hypothetical protein
MASGCVWQQYHLVANDLQVQKASASPRLRRMGRPILRSLGEAGPDMLPHHRACFRIRPLCQFRKTGCVVLPSVILVCGSATHPVRRSESCTRSASFPVIAAAFAPPQLRVRAVLRPAQMPVMASGNPWIQPPRACGHVTRKTEAPVLSHFKTSREAFLLDKTGRSIGQVWRGSMELFLKKFK